METEDYVSYPVALALKRAGFDWKCRAHYTNDYVNDDSEDVSREVKFHYDWTSPYDYNRIVGSTSAPTLWQAQKWLRGKKGYVISIHPESKFFEKTYQHTGWNYSIILISKTGIMFSGPIGNILVEKYEQALSAGIEAALELIEEKG